MGTSKVLDRPPVPDAALYETDFFAWTEVQARKLRDRSSTAIDWDTLAEEIESVGRSQRHEIGNRLVVLLADVLKWQDQPAGRCKSWQSSIGEQRRHIEGLIELSPGLRRFPAERLAWAYRFARRSAATEAGLPPATFPADCSYPMEAVLDIGFMPGPPWSPEQPIRD